MHHLINKLLGKKGITDPNQLSPEEKVTFDSWQAVLIKEELTVEEIKNFCKSQIGAIESKWANLETDNVKKAQLIPYHTVYKLILSAIDSPKNAREALEKNLTQLLNV